MLCFYPPPDIRDGFIPQQRHADLYRQLRSYPKRVMIFVYLVSVPANILFNTVSGTGNTRSALFIELIALVAYVLSVIYLVIYLKADVAICWTTEYIYLVCMFSLTYWYMKKGNWKNKKI